MAADDPQAGLWGPSAAPVEAGRWGPAPAGRAGTAVLDRPPVARRAVVAPVGPVPGQADPPAWEWGTSHRLRNALLIAAAILLLGSLIAAFVVFRSSDDKKVSPGQPDAPVVLQPVTPDGGASATTLPSLPPVSAVTPIPVTTAPPSAPTPTTATPPAPATTKAPTPTTRVTSPPFTASPPAKPPTPTTKPVTTTSVSPPVSR